MHSDFIQNKDTKNSMLNKYPNFTPQKTKASKATQTQTQQNHTLKGKKNVNLTVINNANSNVNVNKQPVTSITQKQKHELTKEPLQIGSKQGTDNSNNSNDFDK